MTGILTDRIAVVTGGASGIGKACVDAMLAAGATVGVMDRSAMPTEPAGATEMLADVTDQESVTKAIDAFCQTHGRLDVLVNNAGISFVGDIGAGTEEDWWRVFDVNVFGQMRVLRSALPWMRRSDSASIILMSSCSALNGIPNRALYSASKGAVQSLMLALAADLVEEGIRVNAIAPATVDTPFMAEIIERSEDPASMRSSLEARQPTHRLVDPTEIGNAAVYLAGNASRSTTGATLEIDGGMGTIRPKK